jgi:hypothetical protein
MDDVFGVGKVVEKLADPVVDLIKRVAGPAADEVGLTFRDTVHVYRAQRAYKLAAKFRRFTNERGIEPQAISLKLLLPILDGASIRYKRAQSSAGLDYRAERRRSTVWSQFVDTLKQPMARLCARGVAPVLALQHGDDLRQGGKVENAGTLWRTKRGGPEKWPSVRCFPHGRQWRTSRAAARRSYRSSSSREPLQTRAVLGRLDYRAERRRSTVWSQFVDNS